MNRATWVAWACFRTGCIYHAFSEHVYCLALGLGPSMEPAISSGDVMLAARVHSRTKLKVGDVVCAKDLHDPSRIIIKRVAGTGGDTMEGKKGGPGTDRVERGSIVVPPGHVWLLGDNQSVSRDSRDLGCFPLGMVLAVSYPIIVVWGRSQLRVVVVAGYYRPIISCSLPPCMFVLQTNALLFFVHINSQKNTWVVWPLNKFGPLPSQRVTWSVVWLALI